jgi:hypothetical protein
MYTDVFILYEYHENVGFWVWWWSGEVNLNFIIKTVVERWLLTGTKHPWTYLFL